MKNKLFILFIFFAYSQCCHAQEKLHVVIVGLSHDHVNRMLGKHTAGEISIVGIAEANQQLSNKKKAAYQLPDSIFYKDLATALKKCHPDLVMVYNAPTEHLAVIKTCMPLHIPVMVEKPLCFSSAEAAAIQLLSKKFNTKVFTNFPSAWYSSFIELVKRSNEMRAINKMAMHGGHRGPVEIGCSKDFTNWLTDPEKNGGGAITDFGCYGASIMTELMKGKKPVAVFAIARHLKPAVYSKADDDASIVLEYANATGIIEASWNWPYTIMDAEVYSEDVYLHAAQFNESNEAPSLQLKNGHETTAEAISAPPYKDEVAYLTAVIKNGAADNISLLSLERNIIVVQILDAARRSVKEARKILL